MLGTKMIKYRAIIMLLIALSLSISCEKNADTSGFFTEDMLSIATFLESNQEEYSRYWQLVEKTGLFPSLNAYNPKGINFTLFLPTDDAFERYIADNDKYSSFEDLLNDYEFIWTLTRYHILNRSVRTSDFPYGALPDSTATGDYLTISIEVTEDTTLYRVNNTSPLIAMDIETINGYIHIIDNVLEPIINNSYEWLENQEGYSIISKALELTGLKDTMGVYRVSESGDQIQNQFTVLAEHDSIYHRAGIQTAEDLVSKYATPGLEYPDPENLLYQFAAFHLLEGSYFLDEFTGLSNYNSYAIYPVSISSGLEIKINTGVDSFGYEITGSDTTLIDYINLFYQESNVNTKTGPIHFISQVMELYRPSLATRTFQFLEEPQIIEAKSSPGTYEFFDPENFEVLWWEGPESIIYEKSSSTGSGQPLNGDYLDIGGNFTIHYSMPKIMPGIYKVELSMQRTNSSNATIRVFIDGKRMGGNINLTNGGSGNDPYPIFEIGTVNFSTYKEHEIIISSLIPGKMKWDFVRFNPEQGK